ncbi:MAG: hypothetical protein PSN04_03315 [Methyloprofundus sp.]|nr:hypothetical protein [Methyloprofundus sp.]
MTTKKGGKRANSGRKSSWSFPSGTELKLIKLPIQIVKSLRDVKARMTGGELIKLLNQNPDQKVNDLLKENALLRDQALSGTCKLWVKHNVAGINDGTICSNIAVQAKEALGLDASDYSHNREVNTWLSKRTQEQMQVLIENAKLETRVKRQEKYKGRY